MLPAATTGPAPFPVPDRIGKYTVINKVGQGTTGTVYLAHDPDLRRDVALKVYNAAAAHPGRRPFGAEERLVGLLRHPNILPILAAGEAGGQHYVVTEHVRRARTLEAYCRPGNLLHVEDVVKIAFKAARALHYAHRHGVIHRDVKPGNILLTDDNDVRIIDFGIALLAGAGGSKVAGLAGSPSYMSPEQVQGHALTPASDLYSLGAVMYELLTGYRPFRAASLGRLLNQIAYSTPAPVHTLRPDMPEALEEVVAIALQKDPARRHASGAALAGHLASVYRALKARWDDADRPDRAATLRQLAFFHDFSHGDIRAILRASDWHEYGPGDEILREGCIDDRFHVVVAGRVRMERRGRLLGCLGAGDCFSEAGGGTGTPATAGVRADAAATILTVSATLLEQAPAGCQLRFNKGFLRALIRRLQGMVPGPVPAPGHTERSGAR